MAPVVRPLFSSRAKRFFKANILHLIVFCPAFVILCTSTTYFIILNHGPENPFSHIHELKNDPEY